MKRESAKISRRGLIQASAVVAASVAAPALARPADAADQKTAHHAAPKPTAVPSAVSSSRRIGSTIRHEASTSRYTQTLEHELQGELNEPWIIQLATGNSETRVVGFATCGVRWAKLDAIKRIEELRPELQTELFTRTEARRLE